MNEVKNESRNNEKFLIQKLFDKIFEMETYQKQTRKLSMMH